MLMLMFILILMLILMLMLMFCLMLIEFSVMAAGTQTLTLSRPQQPRRCRERYFFSPFLLKYKQQKGNYPASHIDVQVNMDLFLLKVGIAGDFVANGNMIFPSQSRFLRRLMVRADQRLLFFSGFSHFLKSFRPLQFLFSFS